MFLTGPVTLRISAVCWNYSQGTDTRDSDSLCRSLPDPSIPGDVSATQHTLDSRNANAYRDVGDKSVVNPVACKSDDKNQILHGPNSVPYEKALGPIGQAWGLMAKSPRYSQAQFGGLG